MDTNLVRKPLSYDISYDVDGVTGSYNCIFGAITNAKNFAGVDLYKNVSLQDGKIEMLLLKNMDPKTMFNLFQDYLKNTVDLNKYKDNMLLMQGKSIKLNFNGITPKYSVDIDGENSGIKFVDNMLDFKVEKQIKIMKRK